MDISKHPPLLSVSDFKKLEISVSNHTTISAASLESLSSFPIGKLNPGHNIFICSVTCPDSAKYFINNIMPMIKNGTPVLMANFIRNDDDLNIWIRIFKLKAIHRMSLVSDIYHAAYKGTLKSPSDVNRFLDTELSSVPIDKVYSGFTVKEAALSGLATTVGLAQIYEVTATPVFAKLR